MPKLRRVFCLALPASLFAQRTINVPKDQPNIQAGIDAAAYGDTVLVAPFGRGFADSSEFFALASAFPLALLGFQRRRSLMRGLLVVVLMAGSLAAVSGCGSKYPDHTPAGAYDIVVMASGAPAGYTAATSTQTLHVGLTVTR